MLDQSILKVHIACWKLSYHSFLAPPGVEVEVVNSSELL